MKSTANRMGEIRTILEASSFSAAVKRTRRIGRHYSLLRYTLNKTTTMTRAPSAENRRLYESRWCSRSLLW